MGICCCCGCSELSSGTMVIDFATIIKKADAADSRKSTPPPRQLQQKQLEVAANDRSAPGLSLPLSPKQSMEDQPENSEVEARLPVVSSNLVIPGPASSGLDMLRDNSRESSCNTEREYVGTLPVKTQETIQLINTISNSYEEDEQVDEETLPVSRVYLTEALSGEWQDHEARHSHSSSIGVHSKDVSWLRNDFEPDFIETLQLAEEKMFIDERKVNKERLHMEPIREEESLRTDSKESGELSAPDVHSTKNNELDDDTKQDDFRSLHSEMDIPMTIDEEEIVNPEKAAFLNDVLSRSTNPKVTNKEMRALKRKLVDAYIDAIPSSRRHLTMISFAVDQIWKDVTDRDSGNLKLLGNQYTKELKWLRSKKDEHTQKESSENLLKNVRTKLHSRVGVGYSPNYDDDPKEGHSRYKTPDMNLIVRDVKFDDKSKS